MTTPDISWFNIASKKMDWVTTRQKAISENIANADTPGYIGRDVESFSDFLDKSSSSADVEAEVSEASNEWSGSFDGNRVVLEEQALLASGSSSEFALATKLYRKGYALIAMAAGKN